MVISLAGEWDVYRREELQERIEPAFTEDSVVFDLTAAKYVTSTLIGALLTAQKRRRQAQLNPAAIAVKSAFVRRLFTAVGVDGRFPIYESVDDALQGAA